MKSFGDALRGYPGQASGHFQNRREAASSTLLRSKSFA